MARQDFYASAFGAFYGFYMERPAIARRISRLVWGGDLSRYYASMAAIAEAESGTTIVDCPCGAGAAFRTVPPADGVRYVAVDLSPSMLDRARARARERGLDRIELIRAPATEIPLPPSTADLFLSFWGLHCFDDPAGALAEAARVLVPGGRLLGCTFVRGDETLRQRRLIRPGLGDFGAVASAEEVESHLASAGLEATAISRSGPMLYFDAVLADAPASAASEPLRAAGASESLRAAAASDLERAGGRDAAIEITPYDPSWPARFERERLRLAEAVGPLELHHIGSTAVPGLAAKPVIDMMAVADPPDGPVRALVELAGYQFPEAYNASLRGRRWLCYPSPAERTHHLHLVEDPAVLDDHLRFRDRLRSDEALRERYADLKRRLALSHRDDREGYTVAKAEFVERVLAEPR